MKLFVMSLSAMNFGDRLCSSRKGGIGGRGWVHPKGPGADSMAVSEFRFRNALVGPVWATAVLLCTNELRKQSSCPARHTFSGGEAFIPVWVSGCWLSAMTTASSLMGGCGLRH